MVKRKVANNESFMFFFFPFSFFGASALGDDRRRGDGLGLGC